MKIICTQETLAPFSPNEISILYHGFVNKHCNYTTEFDFIFKLDTTYSVMGIRKWENRTHLEYLIDLSEHYIDPPDIKQKHIAPFWFAAPLFTVTDPTLPTNWFVKKITLNRQQGLILNRIDFLLGYDELCNKENHDEDLFNREPNAVKTFYQRRKEQEKQEEIEKETCICRPI